MKAKPMGTQTLYSSERSLDRMIQDLSTRKTSRALDPSERVVAQRLKKWASEDQLEQIEGLLKSTKGETHE